MPDWVDSLDRVQSAALITRTGETGTLDERRQNLRSLENSIGELRLRMMTAPEAAGLYARQMLTQLKDTDRFSDLPLDAKWQRRRDALEMSLTNFLGQAQTEAGDWDGAAATYERCLDLGAAFQVPEFQADSLIKSGKAYRHASKLSEARRAFERAAVISELYGLFLLEGESLYQQAVLDELENRPEDALRHYQAGLRLSQSQRIYSLNVRFLSQLGQLHHSRGEYETGLDYYQRCLKLLREVDNDLESETIILGQISHIYSETRDLKGGVAAAEEGLRLSRQTGQQAEETAFLSDLARLYGRLGEYGRALAYATEARERARERNLATDLKNAELLLERIKHQQMLHPNDPAATADLVVTEPDIKGVAVYYQRGNRYYHKGAFDRAISAYSRAISLDPNYTMAYVNRGSAYSAKGHYDRALADYNKALELDPSDAVTYFNRGNAYRKRREYEKALSDYSHSIQLDPNDPDAYFNRGEVLRRLGRLQEAASDFRIVIGLSTGVDANGVEQARLILGDMRMPL